MPSKSEERRLKSQEKEEEKTDVVDDGLQNFSYPTLGGAVIKAKSQKEADKIAAKLTEDLKAQDEAAKKAAEDKPEA